MNRAVGQGHISEVSDSGVTIYSLIGIVRILDVYQEGLNYRPSLTLFPLSKDGPEPPAPNWRVTLAYSRIDGIDTESLSNESIIHTQESAAEAL